MTDKIFEEIETIIMQNLTDIPGKYKSQYELYDKLLLKLDINDPTHKNNIKIKFLTVLRALPFTFNYIDVINKNDILYACFCPDEPFKEEDKIINEVPTENVMPNDSAVVNFILDENIEQYFNRKDYEGNTLLHTLILNKDSKRIKKYFSILQDLLYEKNNDKKTPLELNTDINILNLFIDNLYDENSEMKNKLNKILNDQDSVNSEIGIQFYVNIILFSFLIFNSMSLLYIKYKNYTV